MLRKQKLHITSACIAYLWGIGINDHPLLDYGVACGDQLILTLKLYYAATACANFIDIPEITKMRNFDMCLFCGFQNCQLLIDGNLLMINRYRYHFVVLPPLNTPKP